LLQSSSSSSGSTNVGVTQQTESHENAPVFAA
jgi:hypothetical protein